MSIKSNLLTLIPSNLFSQLKHILFLRLHGTATLFLHVIWKCQQRFVSAVMVDMGWKRPVDDLYFSGVAQRLLAVQYSNNKAPIAREQMQQDSLLVCSSPSFLCAHSPVHYIPCCQRLYQSFQLWKLPISLMPNMMFSLILGILHIGEVTIVRGSAHLLNTMN